MSSAILPIGTVNLLTGKCSGRDACWPSVWECWPERADEHNMLIQFESGKLKVVHTSGPGDAVGHTAYFHHDQTRRTYGRATVIAMQPHTPAGLKQLAGIAGQRSLVMATYK